MVFVSLCLMLVVSGEITPAGTTSGQVPCVSSSLSAGLYRTERDKGTLYELFFAKEDSSSFRHVTLFRPFGPLMKVRSTAVETQGVVINVIVPLAGRVETFMQFLLNFRWAPPSPVAPPRAPGPGLTTGFH